MIKAVFFDAIKTLFEPQPSEIGLYRKVIEKITGIQIPSEELGPILVEAMARTEALDSVKADSFQQWAYFPAMIAELIGCEKSKCEMIGGQIRYETWGRPENYKLFDDVMPTLKKLREANMYVACVSNEDGWLNNFFEHFGISEYFKFIITSVEAGSEKPNPEIFQKALQRADIKAEDVLFVGDSLISDYQGSTGVGMRPLLIDRDHQNHDDNVVAIDNLEKVLEYMHD